MNYALAEILKENDARLAAIAAKFNPITGENSVGERFVFELKDFPIKVQHLPVSMRKVPLVKQLKKAGSIKKFLEDISDVDVLRDEVSYQEDRLKVIEQFVRLRYKHDFPFWAASLVYIKAKGGGDDVLFRLNRPQRRLIARFEKMRLGAAKSSSVGWINGNTNLYRLAATGAQGGTQQSYCRACQGLIYRGEGHVR